ncbi:TPA: porin, partial [Klebsiella aerogenes]|nr:porin [Klebsiella aerogenes]
MPSFLVFLLDNLVYGVEFVNINFFIFESRILATSVLLLAVFPAMSAEIYNHNGSRLDFNAKINSRHYFSDNSDLDGDDSYLRFGFKGETPISDKLTGYGQWQYQASLSQSEAQGTANSHTRLGFAGLKMGDFGSFDFGRNYGVMHDIGAWTDVLPAFEDVPFRTDNFMFQRGNGMATYRTPNFFGLADGLHFAV